MNIIVCRKLALICVVLGVVLVKGCESVPPEYSAFFKLDWEQQREQARTFPIEKQIDFYLAGKKYVHPPSSTLLYVIAERGKSAVPDVLNRMESEQSDAAKLYLLEVIHNIHSFHDDLSGEKDVIENLRVVVSEMNDPNRKAKAEEILTEIAKSRSHQ